MAHYAFLNMNNIVTEVIVGKDENDTNTNWELLYQDFRKQICKRTSYNTHGGVHINPNTGVVSEDQSKSFRKNYAAINYTYDFNRDAFIPPKPFNSWLLDENSCLWKAPVDYPDDGDCYEWDEENESWKKINS